MAAELLLIVVLPVLLALAAGWDLASYTIPNGLQLALIAAFIVFVLATGMTPSMAGGRWALRYSHSVISVAATPSSSPQLLFGLVWIAI